jgi:hypothetical protein
LFPFESGKRVTKQINIHLDFFPIRERLHFKDLPYDTNSCIKKKYSGGTGV